MKEQIAKIRALLDDLEANAEGAEPPEAELDADESPEESSDKEMRKAGLLATFAKKQKQPKE